MDLNEIKVDYYFQPDEIFKYDEDLRLINFNSSGSLLAVTSKIKNIIVILDFISKSQILEIREFESMQSQNPKEIIELKGITWSEDSGKLIVLYKKTNISKPETEALFGIKTFQLNFFIQNSPYYRLESDNNLLENISDRVFSVSYEDEVYLVSGSSPFLVLSDNMQINLFKPTLNSSQISKYNYIIKDFSTTSKEKEFFKRPLLLIVKELYIIMILENRKEASLFEYSSLNSTQRAFIENLKEYINIYSIIYAIGVNTQTDILHIELDISKTLLIINSTDKFLRLFKLDKDVIIFCKDFNDPVNKKRWLNCFFYSSDTWKKNKYKKKFKEEAISPSENYNSKVQDMIVTALIDSSSVEFVIYDLNLGVIFKKMEPFKYSCNDFAVHSKNFFSITLLSNKKIFQIYSYYVNQWEGFAPQFSYIDSNKEYIECEEEYDLFMTKMKVLNHQKKGSKAMTDVERRSIFEVKERKNLFFSLRPNEYIDEDFIIRDSKMRLEYIKESVLIKKDGNDEYNEECDE